jgi:hypothetical protein
MEWKHMSSNIREDVVETEKLSSKGDRTNRKIANSLENGT